jgi:hypothetical protein
MLLDTEKGVGHTVTEIKKKKQNKLHLCTSFSREWEYAGLLPRALKLQRGLGSISAGSFDAIRGGASLLWHSSRPL